MAKLERQPDKLRIELADPDGVVIAERTLDGAASCAELGRMAAIVIASWESDVHPEFVRQPAESSGSSAPRHRREPAPAPDLPAASYDVAAGVTLGQADTLAAGASIGAAWFPRGVGLGAGSSARATGAHNRRRYARGALAAVDGEPRARVALGARRLRGRRPRRPDAGLALDRRRRLRAEPFGLRRITWRDRGNSYSVVGLATRRALDRPAGFLLPAAGFHIWH